MSMPHGPHRIAKTGQVVLAKDVLSEVDLAPGDYVYVVPNEQVRGTILIVPADLAVEWFREGRTAAEETGEYVTQE